MLLNSSFQVALGFTNITGYIQGFFAYITLQSLKKIKDELSKLS